jgi:hypothetical protein
MNVVYQTNHPPANASRHRFGMTFSTRTSSEPTGIPMRAEIERADAFVYAMTPDSLPPAGKASGIDPKTPTVKPQIKLEPPETNNSGTA